MEEEGVVLEVTGGTARVRMVESGGCDACAAAGTCKVGAGARVLDAENKAGAKPGQRVLVTIEGGAFLKASFLIYMVPVIALFIGAALGGKLAEAAPGVMSTDMWQAGTGVLFLALSVFGIRLYDRKAKRSRDLRPVVKSVLEG